ncbi:mechanosensitive ion channel family protein [bacterium]|nr:mechanosensitive ion channel family protein [bacterium]
MNDRFIQTQKLYQVLDLEIFIFVTMLGLFAWLFYKFLLRNATAERHANIKNHLKALGQNFAVFGLLFAFYVFCQQASVDDENIRRLLPYLGFAAYIMGALCFVKTCRLLVLQYLFLGSMKAGVPLLLVNIFTLILSIVIAFWTFNNLFGVQLTPLLATSAAFSIILGLALQDTLGNLFAGISLQVDKTFEIGDWLEIMNGSIKIVGQVKELSWRSTVLIGFADEMITLPNKLVAQSQVSNFSPEGAPILRSQTFKFPFNTDIPKTIQILEMAATQISDICAQPPPSAFVLETNDYGISIKLIYFIDNYGRQYGIGDKVVTTALDLLAKNGIQTARPSIHIQQL